jgi:hypothetical protein
MVLTTTNLSLNNFEPINKDGEFSSFIKNAHFIWE